jgi:hypothetical protein
MLRNICPKVINIYEILKHNTTEKRLRMRGNKKDGEEFKCKIINKNMAI